MLSKDKIYRMILAKEFGIREERNVESNDVYACIYDKKAKNHDALIRTMVLSENDAACWISAAIRCELQRLTSQKRIKNDVYIMERLSDLETIAEELEKDGN